MRYSKSFLFLVQEKNQLSIANALEMILFLAVLFVLSPLVSCVKGPLIWKDEFDGANINQATWKHWITGWRGGVNQFQYYHNYKENRFVTLNLIH